mmetsp:Transcript_7513/g.16812  ORF Transcript_7513/g.16812 Transcript_7513/m.16812 type:complete len:236 (-) Transcript_7513:480-1187(-)
MSLCEGQRECSPTCPLDIEPARPARPYLYARPHPTWCLVRQAHSWSGRGTPIAKAVDLAYGSWLGGSRHEPLGLQTIERVHSMILSVVASLELARAHAAKARQPFDLVMAARYDLFLHETISMEHVDPRALTTALWCTHSSRLPSSDAIKSASLFNPCGPLRLVPFVFGVSDYWFLGSQTLLEWFWGSLQLHRLSELTHDSSLRTQRLSLPQFCTQSPKWQKMGIRQMSKSALCH